MLKRIVSKKTKTVFLVIIAVLALGTTVYADGDYTPGRKFVFSPFTTSLSAWSGSYTVSGSWDFYFDEDGADANNDAWYYTSEMNNVTDGLSYWMQSSNLPDPHYDFDDDNDDGFEEEVEAIEGGLGAGGIEADYPYYHLVYWENTSGPHDGGDIHFIAQQSFINPFTGEYEAKNYDYIDFDSYGPTTSSFAPDTQGTSSITAKPEVQTKNIMVKPEIASIGELQKLKHDQQEFVQTLAKTDLLDATVTFQGPISAELLQSMLAENNARLKDYEVKWLNDQGRWITGHFRRLNSADIEFLQDEMIRLGKETELTYEGITSARIQLSAAAYENLSKHNAVFLVDVTESIVKAAHGPNVKVQVPDLAWKINDIQ